MDDRDKGRSDRYDYEPLVGELFAACTRLARHKPPAGRHSMLRGLPVVMHMLATAGRPLTPGELADGTGVTGARIANALRVLEERGLVERHAQQRDRRRVEVSLTGLGRRRVRERTCETHGQIVSFLRELGPDDAHELVRLMGRVAEVLDARADASSPEGAGD